MHCHGFYALPEQVSKQYQQRPKGQHGTGGNAAGSRFAQAHQKQLDGPGGSRSLRSGPPSHCVSPHLWHGSQALEFALSFEDEKLDEVSDMRGSPDRLSCMSLITAWCNFVVAWMPCARSYMRGRTVWPSTLGPIALAFGNPNHTLRRAIEGSSYCVPCSTARAQCSIGS